MGPPKDACHIWISKKKKPVKYNPFKQKYPERLEPKTLSFWAIAFIAEYGYLEVGADVRLFTSI